MRIAQFDSNSLRITSHCLAEVGIDHRQHFLTIEAEIVGQFIAAMTPHPFHWTEREKLPFQFPRESVPGLLSQAGEPVSPAEAPDPDIIMRRLRYLGKDHDPSDGLPNDSLSKAGAASPWCTPCSRSGTAGFDEIVNRPFHCGLMSILFLKPFGKTVALDPTERVGVAETGERGW